MTRPTGINITAVLMSITNAMGWMIIDWHASRAVLRGATYTILILVGYVFVWFYWKGRNWARISVILCFAVAVVNLTGWNSTKPGTILWVRHTMIATEAMLGIFLLYWLNTSDVREFFRRRAD
jgi:hypothetical protein